MIRFEYCACISLAFCLLHGCFGIRPLLTQFNGSINYVNHDSIQSVDSVIEAPHCYRIHTTLPVLLCCLLSCWDLSALYGSRVSNDLPYAARNLNSLLSSHCVTVDTHTFSLSLSL